MKYTITDNEYNTLITIIGLVSNEFCVSYNTIPLIKKLTLPQIDALYYKIGLWYEGQSNEIFTQEEFKIVKNCILICEEYLKNNRDCDELNPDHLKNIKLIIGLGEN